jgi:hypothetical protein
VTLINCLIATRGLFALLSEDEDEEDEGESEATRGVGGGIAK